MKNREKFAKELIEFRSVSFNKNTNQVGCCDGVVDCDNCMFNVIDGCQVAYTKWLDEEYIEPRVEFKEMEIVEVKDDTDYWILGYFKEYTEYGFVRIYKFNNKKVTFTYKHVRKVVQNGNI